MCDITRARSLRKSMSCTIRDDAVKKNQRQPLSRRNRKEQEGLQGLLKEPKEAAKSGTDADMDGEAARQAQTHQSQVCFWHGAPAWMHGHYPMPRKQTALCGLPLHLEP